MMQPHKLDDEFEHPERFAQSRAFQQAIRKAAEAFKSQANALRNEPGLMSGSPAQTALSAFLDELGLKRDYGNDE